MTLDDAVAAGDGARLRANKDVTALLVRIKQLEALLREAAEFVHDPGVDGVYFSSRDWLARYRATTDLDKAEYEYRAVWPDGPACSPSRDRSEIERYVRDVARLTGGGDRVPARLQRRRIIPLPEWENVDE